MTSKERKVRLDRLLVERGISPTGERARALILSGAVLVDERPVDKAGTAVSADVELRIRGEDNPYVSRGGLKLKAALTAFGIDAKGLTALDVGASTGGFTDCLLQEGARKVYAVDVGYGQFAWSLRKDPRVVLFERTNIRFFSGEGIEDKIDIVVIDTSFISLRIVIPAALKLLKGRATVVALVKPQFEAGQGEVGKRGVVRDPALRRKILDGMVEFCRSLGLRVSGTCESPLLGPAGNKEFFVHAVKEENSGSSTAMEMVET